MENRGALKIGIVCLKIIALAGIIQRKARRGALPAGFR